MTRDSLVDICNHQLSGSLTPIDIVAVLEAYCEDKSPSKGLEWTSIKDSMDLCIATLITEGGWQSFFDRALLYLTSKYKVTLLSGPRKTTHTPLGLVEQREPLIYL